MSQKLLDSTSTGRVCAPFLYASMTSYGSGRPSNNRGFVSSALETRSSPWRVERNQPWRGEVREVSNIADVEGSGSAQADVHRRPSGGNCCTAPRRRTSAGAGREERGRRRRRRASAGDGGARRSSARGPAPAHLPGEELDGLPQDREGHGGADRPPDGHVGRGVHVAVLGLAPRQVAHGDGQLAAGPPVQLQERQVGVARVLLQQAAEVVQRLRGGAASARSREGVLSQRRAARRLGRAGGGSHLVGGVQAQLAKEAEPPRDPPRPDGRAPRPVEERRQVEPVGLGAHLRAVQAQRHCRGGGSASETRAGRGAPAVGARDDARRARRGLTEEGRGAAGARGRDAFHVGQDAQLLEGQDHAGVDDALGAAALEDHVLERVVGVGACAGTAGRRRAVSAERHATATLAQVILPTNTEDVLKKRAKHAATTEARVRSEPVDGRRPTASLV